METENDVVEEETIQNENNCDNNISPLEKKSCQFLKCIPKEKTSCDNEINYDNIINSSTTINTNEINFDDCSDNACARDNIVRVGVDQIFAKINEADDWTIKWNIDDRHEQDFIALCYVGKFIIT